MFQYNWAGLRNETEKKCQLIKTEMVCSMEIFLRWKECRQETLLCRCWVESGSKGPLDQGVEGSEKLPELWELNRKPGMTVCSLGLRAGSLQGKREMKLWSLIAHDNNT